MKLKAFIIGLLLTVVFGVIFCFYEYTIPAVLFAGVFGGIYVGNQRKRPITACMYDGFIVSIPASLALSAALVPLLWYLHDFRSDIAFLPFFFLVVGGCIILVGLVGGPTGGLFSGLYHHYLKKDRGETELYESLIEDKTDNPPPKKRRFLRL